MGSGLVFFGSAFFAFSLGCLGIAERILRHKVRLLIVVKMGENEVIQDWYRGNLESGKDVQGAMSVSTPCRFYRK